jgi:hypothetical protein
MKPKILP